jgi:predicted dehydrogenase
MEHTSRTSRGVLVGTGFFAQYHAEAWSRISEARIVAVVDPALDRATAFARQYGIDIVYSSLPDALQRERPDFVDIVTRPETHLSLTRQAAERRVHVICQKPMAPTLDECRRMVTACEAAGVRLLVHENWRWQPWYREVRALLDAGRLGRPFQFSFRWRTADGRGSAPYAVQPYFRDMSQLLVYETLVHLLDTFRFLGGEFAGISCQNRRINPEIRGEDQSIILISLRSGALGLIDANRISGPTPQGPAMGCLTVEGEHAVLRMSPDGRLWIIDVGQSERPHGFDIPDAGYKGDSVFATQRHLLRCLHSGEQSESDGRDYLNTVKAVFACYTSATNGGGAIALDSEFDDAARELK